jgi:hypothetical protein
MDMNDLATVPLTPVEREQLADYEATIQRGLNTFYEVAAAFVHIKQRKLYRAEYRTFEEYCKAKWNIDRSYADRMIEAAEVRENLVPIGTVLPEKESHARALVGLEPDQQRQVWQKAVDTAPNGKVTAQHIKDVRQAEIPIPEPAPADPAPVPPPSMVFRNCDTCKQKYLIQSDAVRNGRYVCHYCLAKEDDAPARPNYGPCAKCGTPLTGPGTFWYDGKHHDDSAICDACRPAYQPKPIIVFIPDPLYEERKGWTCTTCQQQFTDEYGFFYRSGRAVCLTCIETSDPCAACKSAHDTCNDCCDTCKHTCNAKQDCRLNVQSDDGPAEREPDAVRHFCATCETVIVPEFEQELQGKYYHPNCTPKEPESEQVDLDEEFQLLEFGFFMRDREKIVHAGLRLLRVGQRLGTNELQELKALKSGGKGYSFQIIEKFDTKAAMQRRIKDLEHDERIIFENHL